jgi:hypothetical protein
MYSFPGPQIDRVQEVLPSGHKRDFSGEVGASATDRCIDIGEAAFIMELVFLEIRKIIVRFVLSIFNEVQFRPFIKRKFPE